MRKYVSRVMMSFILNHSDRCDPLPVCRHRYNRHHSLYLYPMPPSVFNQVVSIAHSKKWLEKKDRRYNARKMVRY